MDYSCPIYKKPLDPQPLPLGLPRAIVMAHDGAAAFPIEVETTQVTVRLGQTLVIAGPNGVGKSALLGEIARGIGVGVGKPEFVETFFGSRQIQFQNDEVDQVGQNLKTFQTQLNNVTRFRHPWGEQHLKSVVRRLLNQDSQTNSDIVGQVELGVDYHVALGSRIRTIRAINVAFEAARMPVRFELEDGALRVRRGGASYNIDRLSDGERAALLVAGAVLIRPQDSFIVIDEPERHLNPAISGPLLAALMRVRRDVGFIFSTHDLNLLNWLQPQCVVHLRDSSLITENPEQRCYDYSILPQTDDVPEELKFAILGTRRQLLLVEGTAKSEDRALYGQLYPEWNVVATGSCEAVISGVKSLGGHEDYHWLKVAGLIDGDGRSPAQVGALAAQNVYALPCPSIENLFLNPAVLAEMANAAHEFFAGPSGAERIAAVEAMLPATLAQAKDEIIARRVVWAAQRAAQTNMVSVKEVRTKSVTEVPAIDLAPLSAAAKAEFAAALSGGATLVSLQAVPIKATPVPQEIAKVLGYPHFDAYKQAVLGQIEADRDRGKAIRAALLLVLPRIAP